MVPSAARRSLPLSLILCCIVCAPSVGGCSPGIFHGIQSLLHGRFAKEEQDATQSVMAASASSTGFQSVPSMQPLTVPPSSAMQPSFSESNKPELDLPRADASLDAEVQADEAYPAGAGAHSDLGGGDAPALPPPQTPDLQLPSAGMQHDAEARALETQQTQPLVPPSQEQEDIRLDGYGLSREEEFPSIDVRSGAGDLRREEELARFAAWSEQQLEPFLPDVLRNALAGVGVTLEGAGRAADAVSGGRLGAAVGEARAWVAAKQAWVAAQPEVVMWQLQPGDHLRVRGVAGLMALTHHAIYLGDGRILHFTGGVQDKANATCKVDSLRALYNFGRGSGMRVEVVEHPVDALPRDIIVQRALTRVGQTGYNLFSNNCEHLVYWCITGQYRSGQIERFRHDPLGLGKDILAGQAAVGQPIGLQQIAHTLLPPSILRPVAMVREQQQAFNRWLNRHNAPPPPDPPQPPPSNPLAAVQRWLQLRLPQPPSPSPAQAPA